MGFFEKLFGIETAPQKKAQPFPPVDDLMTSQFPAFYLNANYNKLRKLYRDLYISRLKCIGFTENNAEKMFEFECDIIRRCDKPYLLDPQFTQSWLFDLSVPFLPNSYTQEAILKEKLLTIGELAKIIDEAEYHWWNSRERLDISPAAYTEIRHWFYNRPLLNGPGERFTVSYFKAISEETGIPYEHLGNFCGLEGHHLKWKKWRS